MGTIEEKVKTLLDAANKLIFVKKYENAVRLFDETLKNDMDLHNNISVHLRRIELGCQMGQARDLLNQYQEDLRRQRLNVSLGNLCIHFIEQHGKLVSSAHSIQSFSDHILHYGESAAAYYGIALSLEVEGNQERALFNYQQSVKLDPNWYSSYFGMSQIFYQKHDVSQGNHYFYLFEEHAPYNLYGNIQTHRSLSAEFLANKHYDDAIMAIHTLSEWWIENQKYCPREIQVLELLTQTQIESQRNAKDDTRFMQTIRDLVHAILLDSHTKMEDLQFLAKILLEFKQTQLNASVYKKIVEKVSHDLNSVLAMGVDCLNHNDLIHAHELFLAASEAFPEQHDVRMYLLTTRLKLLNIDPQNYLSKKKYAEQKYYENADAKTVYADLSELIRIYPEDADVHRMSGDLAITLGNKDLARDHYLRMYQLESKRLSTVLHYAGYLIHYDNIEEGFQLLKDQHHASPEMQAEIQALTALYYERKKDVLTAVTHIRSALDYAPWNPGYLCQIIRCQMHEVYSESAPQEAVTRMTEGVDLHKEDWMEFDLMTEKLAKEHHNFLVYNRSKLRLLTSGGKIPAHDVWLNRAIEFDPMKAAHESLKLLNTNFDSPNLYWTLGILFKEAGSSEISEMWLEILLESPLLVETLRAQVLIELGDSYTWRGVHLEKALAYLRMVRDIPNSPFRQKALLKMSHTHLKLGDVRSARECLEAVQSKESSLESAYLQGLLCYRDGSVTKAKTYWKPLLTVKAVHIQDHWIKKAILDFYFEKKSYIQSS